MPLPDSRRTTLPALRVGVLALGAALCADTLAAAAGAPSVSLSGFGTLGVVHSSERQADFSSSVLKATGAGYSRAWSAQVDSRLGVQLDAALGRRWSAVLQVVSEQHLDGSYAPVLEWANIKYQATPDLALRAGRIALPMFLAADYRKVGYAYPWVRPPLEVYGSMPIASSDGIDLTWRWGAGGVRHATQAFYGRTDLALTGGSSLQAHGLAGFSHTLETGALTARVSALSAVVSLDVARQLFDAVAAFGPAGPALADRYDVDSKRVTVTSLGASYDPGSWFAMGEAVHTGSRSFLGKTSTLYASTGLRHGAFTPYVAYARVRADIPTRESGLPLAGLAPAQAAIGATLNYGLNALLKAIPVQSSVSAGVRWDARPNLALKLQLDRVTPDDGSRGTLINTQRGFVSGRSLQVASLALDFVY